MPIGCWVASLVFDVATRWSADSVFLARGSLWLIGIGVVGALAAAMVGFLDFFVLPGGTRAFRTGLLHMVLNLLVTAAYAVNFTWRRADQDVVALGPLALSVASLAVLGVAGFLGGKLAFRYGVRVADEATQADGYRN